MQCRSGHGRDVRVQNRFQEGTQGLCGLGRRYGRDIQLQEQFFNLCNRYFFGTRQENHLADGDGVAIGNGPLLYQLLDLFSGFGGNQKLPDRVGKLGKTLKDRRPLVACFAIQHGVIRAIGEVFRQIHH